MKDRYLHIVNDNKQYIENYGGGGGRGGGGGGGRGGGGGGGRGGFHGGGGGFHGGGGGFHGGGGGGGFHGGGRFHGGGGGFHGGGGRFHGGGGRFRGGGGYYNNRRWGGVNWLYPYQYMNTYNCTPENNNPFDTGAEVSCCPGLRTCYADWNDNNNPYYLCKESCD